MGAQPTTQYSPRLPAGTSAHLRVTLERDLTTQLQAAQNIPQLHIRTTRRPSTSLLLRRALRRYMAALAMMSPDQLTDEGSELLKLS